MPQMAPISWMILFILFSLIFIIFNIMNYYNFININKNTTIMNSNDTLNKDMPISLNWKW